MKFETNKIEREKKKNCRQTIIVLILIEYNEELCSTQWTNTLSERVSLYISFCLNNSSFFFQWIPFSIFFLSFVIWSMCPNRNQRRCRWPFLVLILIMYLSEFLFLFFFLFLYSMPSAQQLMKIDYDLCIHCC